MLNHNQNLSLIVSACLASLQKFLKGKSDGYEWLICIVQRMHSLSSPSRCFSGGGGSFSLSFVLRCYNNFHLRQNATNISVFLSHSEILQAVLVTQPTKSKSLFKLFKERVIVNFGDYFCCITYFQLDLPTSRPFREGERERKSTLFLERRSREGERERRNQELLERTFRKSNFQLSF